MRTWTLLVVFGIAVLAAAVVPAKGTKSRPKLGPLTGASDFNEATISVG